MMREAEQAGGFNAPFHLSTLDSPHLTILRDDLLPGGTKRRALSTLVRTLPHHIFYAGTVMGHGALALAYACAEAGRTAQIMIAADDAHPFVQKLRGAGARVYTHRPMPIAALHALAGDAACEYSGGGFVFPPGFSTPEFDDALAKALADFDAAPYPEIWVASVTGTLARALKKAHPGKKIITVSVVKNGEGDFTAPEKYHQTSKSPPPYPACPYTDAKLWQFATRHAAPGALL